MKDMNGMNRSIDVVNKQAADALMFGRAKTDLQKDVRHMNAMDEYLNREKTSTDSSTSKITYRSN